jgi:hypothetical protein
MALFGEFDRRTCKILSPVKLKKRTGSAPDLEIVFGLGWLWKPR